MVGLRPEAFALVATGEGLAGRVDLVEDLGSDAFLHLTADVLGHAAQVVVRVEGRRPPARGSAVALRPHTDEAHLFSVVTGERL